MSQNAFGSAKLLYTARVHSIGGREKGEAHSSDGRLNVTLSAPGGPGTGTNPEQLLAAGWSACFESALAYVAKKREVPLPADLAIDAEVDLYLVGSSDYFLRARMTIGVPGTERSVAQQLLDAAHQLCPYSKAMRGNIDVSINLV